MYFYLKIVLYETIERKKNTVGLNIAFMKFTYNNIHMYKLQNVMYQEQEENGDKWDIPF